MSKRSVKPMNILKELKNVLKSDDPRKELKPVYCVYGEESFIRERVALRLKHIVSNCGGAIERTIFGKTDMDEWINDLNEIPMFSNFRLVIASELSDLKTAESEKLLEYVKNPSPDVILLLLSYNIDRRKKKIADIVEIAYSCEAKHPKENELSIWIKGFAAERRKNIDSYSIELLKSRYGTDLSKLEKEIEKIVLYIGDKTEITKKDAEYIASGLSNCSVFDLFPLLSNKNKKGLYSAIYKILSSGENPRVLHSLLTGRIKKLLLGFDALNSEDKSDGHLASLAGIHPFFVRDFKTELKNYKREELVSMYKTCIETNASFNRSKRSATDIFLSGVQKLVEHH